MSTPRGRPPKSSPRLTREAILSAAAKRLDDADGRAFSLRLLALDLGVTPMALYSHVDGVDGILDALAERLFAEVPDPGHSDPSGGMQVLLLWYFERVLKHHGLTSALVARHGALPLPHQEWTNRIAALVNSAGLSADWSDILVDHLHGFALSQVAGGLKPEAAFELYRRQIGVLLGKILQEPEEARIV